jgi:two-component system, OmpR family, sensor histidine kinase KdpD
MGGAAAGRRRRYDDAMSPSATRELWRFAGAVGVLGVVTLAWTRWLGLTNAATVATSYLMVVLVVAATSALRIAIATSVVAMLALNFFFLPPVGTFTVADPQNWVALFAFLAVSLVASHLSAQARRQAADALSRRDELARLFDLSRDVLLITDSRDAMTSLARAIGRRFDLEYVAVAMPRNAAWEVFEAGTSLTLPRRDLDNAFASAQASIDFDARSRTYAGHRVADVDGRHVRLVPLRVGTKPIGLLAALGRTVEAGTLDTLAGLAAIAIERAQLLGERQAGEMARQGDQLKTALLASIGHDLRTPLTAIRVAAGNLDAPALDPAERAEQRDIILLEVERLTRLFENILDMARIDAGAVETSTRWTHPSEIVSAARRQVEHALEAHAVVVSLDRDEPVRLDPRLTAAALAHVLENAAQYSPAGSTIDVGGRTGPDGLVLEVRDHGPGIAADDLPHLFDRFYRGATARTRASGTGMGLGIVRGLLAVAGGRAWAENAPGGGARFTIVVPAEARPALAEAPNAS